MILSLAEFYGKFAKHPELTDELKKNAQSTISKASELLSRAGIKTVITSGFRPKDYNKQIGGSPTSQHCYCNAIDLWDPTKELGEWCMKNLEAMIEMGLWMESLTTTHSGDNPKKYWVHTQRVPPKSGDRVFVP